MNVELEKQANAPVLYRNSDGIAEIRFNRPARLNAFSVEIAEGFAGAVDKAVEDPSVRVIVLASEGRAFVAGGDLEHLRKAQDKAQAAGELIGPAHDALKRLASSPKISIASLRGAAAGAGMSLALSVDLAIAADDAKFNLAYVNVATSPDCGGSWALPRLVGMRKALEIALLSETIDAQEALRLGLVNRVVPLAELEAETAKVALRLAGGAGAAQGRTKSLMRMSFERSFDAQLDAEAESFAQCSVTQDFSEALEAFFHKRKPKFNGR